MGSELQDGGYLLASESLEHANDLVNRESVFEILEYRSYGNTSATKHPCPTDLPRNAFHSFAL